jgi:hypothetical protein
MLRAGILSILLFTVSAAAQVSHPADGITLTQQVRHDPLLRVYWAQIDLTNPRIHLRVARGGMPPAGREPWETTLLPVSKIAQREKFVIAVNGSYFAPKDYKFIFGIKDPYYENNLARAVGWTVCDGALLSEHPIDANRTSLVVPCQGKPFIGRLVLPPAGASAVVSGFGIVLDGHNIAPDDAPAPRTAVGLDADAKTLTMFVVDGRRPDYSVGMSLKQVAEEMLQLGCTSAIDLDGGGSTTMALQFGDNYWKLVNAPSDGHTLAIPLCIERPVADALGVVVDPPPEK